MSWLRWIICFFRGHPTKTVDRPYDGSLLTKEVCTFCGYTFVCNTETNGMLHWDAECQRCFDELRKIVK